MLRFSILRTLLLTFSTLHAQVIALVPAGEAASSRRSSCVVNPSHRAGHPESVSRLAIPSKSGRYGGYYVGGGLPLGGEERCPAHEGTWGWDYFGILFPKKIALRWGHGLRNQGGTGAYKTDGPKLRLE